MEKVNKGGCRMTSGKLAFLTVFENDFNFFRPMTGCLIKQMYTLKKMN